ncbi:MAG: hypothetical protein FJX18_05755 [Alphaproteobacteria bacterium]|nr:hypothetical protein [Alphaproteobacteria bacterium]
MRRFFLLFLFAFFEFGYCGRDPSISFVNTGQGNCTVVDCGNDDRLVIDCGFSQAPDDVRRLIEVSFPSASENTKTKKRRAEIGLPL